MSPALRSEDLEEAIGAGCPALTAEQERAIFGAACAMVAAGTLRRPPPLEDPTLCGAARQQVIGVFVSLKRRGRLRGCCGVFGQAMLLAEALGRAAARTATEDPRLPPVSPTELQYLDCEVWLLYGLTPVTARGRDRASQVAIGRHGVQVRRGQAGALLLPGVAVEHQFDAEAFLREVCHKADLPATAWTEDDTQLTTFEGRAIAGPFDAGLAAGAAAPPPRFHEADVVRLATHCRTNILALIQGMMGVCYDHRVADGTVHGLALTLRLPGQHPAPQFAKHSLRPGLPLQAALYGLVEEAVRTLRAEGLDAQALAPLRVGLTLLWDPAMHGTVEDPDLDGVDPGARALLVTEGARSAWVFIPDHASVVLLEEAARAAGVRRPAAAWVVSLAAQSTEPFVTVAEVPRPQAGPRIRPPAVAGSFYPAEAPSLARMVEGLLAGLGDRREPWPAVMVPHAGLRYSGKVAAAVWGRVAIPDVVIVLGPRHHPLGMEWAVAPHESWALPGISVASDPELARQLAEAIPDLHLDALAHAREHSIEMQLPLLARLAPSARAVGIALGAGDLEGCRRFAAGLAEVLRRRDDAPLLVISSDLHHYASDAENRRLDAIALAALERLDPAEVYETIRRHRITMCGLLPAVVVLETLRLLGRLRWCERVAYATSADATGDTTRVVGYGGVLFG